MILERTPIDTPSGRMAPLARLPVFFALEGKRAIVAGGSAAAAWKAELLSAAGAHVDVYAEQFAEEMHALALDPARGSVLLHARKWQARDFANAAIAVGACEDDDSAAAFAAVARSAAVPVNVIDKPAFCDFAFGAIVNRSPMVIGISTNGAAPVFAQTIRAKLEAVLPKGLASWAAAAQSWRAFLRASGLTFAARRKFWEMFAAHAVTHPQDKPSQSDFSRFVAAVKANAAERAPGSVTLVGAGPGNPELLTLRAVRALQSADVILFDDLVSREVLDFARREAKKMLVGKTGFSPSCKQDDINRLMVELAKQGKRIIRLKGGDPLIFGRATEEIEACASAGIPVEIVPGVTAAQGAAATLASPLTGRGRTRRLQYVTGHSREGTLPDLDWRSMADPSTTTAIYMPTRTLDALVSKALEAGLDPATAAIAISRATRPDQQVIRAAIRELPQRIVAASLPGPVLVVIGICAEMAASASADQPTAAAN